MSVDSLAYVVSQHIDRLDAVVEDLVRDVKELELTVRNLTAENERLKQEADEHLGTVKCLRAKEEYIFSSDNNKNRISEIFGDWPEYKKNVTLTKYSERDKKV